MTKKKREVKKAARSVPRAAARSSSDDIDALIDYADEEEDKPDAEDLAEAAEAIEAAEAAEEAPTPRASVPVVRRRWTATEVVTAVALAASEEDMYARLDGMAPSRRILRRARTLLLESSVQGHLGEALEIYAQERGYTLELAPHGGRICPRPGESRVYNVQASRRGPKLYVMLPVNNLKGVAAGGRVVASFADDVISVMTE